MKYHELYTVFSKSGKQVKMGNILNKIWAVKLLYDYYLNDYKHMKFIPMAIVEYCLARNIDLASCCKSASTIVVDRFHDSLSSGLCDCTKE